MVNSDVVKEIEGSSATAPSAAAAYRRWWWQMMVKGDTGQAPSSIYLLFFLLLLLLRLLLSSPFYCPVRRTAAICQSSTRNWSVRSFQPPSTVDWIAANSLVNARWEPLNHRWTWSSPSPPDAAQRSKPPANWDRVPRATPSSGRQLKLDGGMKHRAPAIPRNGTSEKE